MTETERRSITGCDEVAPDIAARLDWITARALAGNRAVTGSGRRAAWSDAAKDRLYGRMFPDDPGADRTFDGTVRSDR